MTQPPVYQVRDFGTLASAIETTDMPGRLVRAVNCLLRPRGAVKGIPRYFRLWATFTSESAQAKIRSLPFTGFATGIGTTEARRLANKCVAVRIYRQGKNFLLLYDLISSKARGLFYMGDDGSFTSGTYDFGAGTPTYEVLAVGLDANARWYGKRQASMLKLSNNVDTPVCVQLGRTATPGKWRRAGSNVAPATPVISKVPPASSTNVQASLTLPAGTGAVKFLADPTADNFWPYDSTGTVVADPANDRITITGFAPVNGMRIVLAGTTAPTGLSFYTQYYAINCVDTSCQLATSITGNNTGTPVTFSTAGTSVEAFNNIRATDTAILDLSANEPVLLFSTGTLPASLANTTYYVVNPQAYTFQVSTSSGGAAEAITDAGTPISGHSFYSLSDQRRVGTAALTFTADTLNFPGADGNSKIKVAITPAPYNTSITSTISGLGTAASPYIYTINTGPTAATSSNDAIVSYVNADTLAVGILRASTSVADATADPMVLAETLLSGGTGTGTSEGLTSQTCSVYLRYFDTGSERIGYEGISSTLSNIIILDEATRSDILVTITPDPSADGGRFDSIRVYFQFGEGSSAIWNLVGTVANTTGTKTLQVGTNTEIGQAMYTDQNRPLPFKDTVMVNNQVWHGGNTTYPERLYVSKPAVEDEIAPEGASATDYYLLALPQQTAATRVTALDTDNFRLHVHTNQGVILIDPDNPDADRHVPQVPVGAFNPACLVKWENSKIYYLGADLQIYEFDGNRYGKRNASAATKDAIEYILSKANLDKISQQPDRVMAWLDSREEMMWYHFPGSDNTLTGFAYDFQQRGVVGEFTYPKVYAMAEMEAERPERVFCDEDGNLFYMDSRSQEDWGDYLTTSNQFTAYSTGVTPPVQYNGYGYVDYQGRRYYQAYQSVIETGFIDLGSIPQFKSFIGVLWTTVANSRAIIDITLTNKAGWSVTRNYGDLAANGIQKIHKAVAMLAGDAVKVRFTVTSAEQAPWIIRNLGLIYRPAGQL